MHLTKFYMENDGCKEDTSLQRIVGHTEDLQLIHNHENNNNELPNDNTSAIVTPTRESRHNKRRFEFIELEEKTKQAYLENNRLATMEHLLVSISKQCSAWETCHESENISKLRKCMCTKNIFFQRIQI